MSLSDIATNALDTTIDTEAISAGLEALKTNLVSLHPVVQQVDELSTELTPEELAAMNDPYIYEDDED